MSKPLKILFCNEASFLSTGFAVYGKEFLKRLSKDPRFYVAELACYGYVNDKRDKDVNWRYYANAVHSHDSRFSVYESNRENPFGRWRFEKTVLDFKPDVVIDIRDYWMNSYQALSPLRRYFHWILMPTIDSYPQQESWLNTYIDADAIFTYSDWAKNVLALQTNNKINYIDTTSPGIDTDIFLSLNKTDCRQKWGIPEDIFLVGSVMRNQKRKLIPELIKTVRSIIDHLVDIKHPLANKIFLYLHTGYPDYAGWNIPNILKEYRMLNRTLLTYVCKACRHVFADVYSGIHRVCPKCKNKSCSMPSVNHGISENDLVALYNTFDFYVQYSICEGFGMPQVEAAACGIPLATVNYSAMEDIVNKLDAQPIRVSTFFKELETQAIRAYPDNEDLKNIIINFINLPQPIKSVKAQKIRSLCNQHYNWDNIYSKWETYLLSLYNQKQEKTFDPYDMIKNMQTKPLLDLEVIKQSRGSIYDKISHIYTHYLDNIDQSNSYEMLNMVNKLITKNSIGDHQVSSYDWEDAVQQFNTMINNHNTIINFVKDNTAIEEDFIQYANIKDPRIKSE